MPNSDLGKSQNNALVTWINSKQNTNYKGGGGGNLEVIVEANIEAIEALPFDF